MKKILIINLLFIFQVCLSQKNRLGEVTIEELKEKVHPIDSTASAAYLFKKGVTKFDLTQDGTWEIVTEVEIKIKIYKKEGFEFANQEVPYFVGSSSKEKVYISNANTFNLVNGKVEKTKLSSESQFKEEVNERWNLKKITFPAVKEGSIIEFKYKIVSPFITNFNDWYFQHSIPVNVVQYNTYIPINFVYRVVISGYESILREESTSDGLIKYSFSAKNVPTIKEEEFVKNIKNYTSILKFELVKIQYPNQSPKSMALTWEDVSKSIYDNDDFGKELNYKSYFDETIQSLIKDAKTDQEKMDLIFQYVQKNMNWNGNNSYACELGVKKAFKEKTGNSADINLMLVAMLRYAGLDAHPIILSTRLNGVAAFPSRSAFNYVIAGVKNSDTDIVLLDASNKNTLPNIIPLKAVNWIGRMLLPDGAIFEVQLEPKSVSNKTITILAEIEDEINLVGKLREVSSEYFAFLFRENNGGKSSESLGEMLEKRYGGIEINDIVVKNENSKPVTLSYSFNSTNAIEIIGDKIYISPLLFLQSDENPFKSVDRKYPVEFDFPQKLNYNISLKLNDQYEVVSLPLPLVIKSENENIGFVFNISSTGNNIQISCNLELLDTVVSADNYKELKEFFNKMLSKQTEKMVLKKK